MEGTGSTRICEKAKFLIAMRPNFTANLFIQWAQSAVESLKKKCTQSPNWKMHSQSIKRVLEHNLTKDHGQYPFPVTLNTAINQIETLTRDVENFHSMDIPGDQASVLHTVFGQIADTLDQLAGQHDTPSFQTDGASQYTSALERLREDASSRFREIKTVAAELRREKGDRKQAAAAESSAKKENEQQKAIESPELVDHSKSTGAAGITMASNSRSTDSNRFARVLTVRRCSRKISFKP